MSALESKLSLTLAANQPGSSTTVLDDVLQYVGAHAGATEEIITLAAGATDQVLALGALATVKLALLISDQPISIKLNAYAVGLAFKNLLLTDTTLTAASLTNGGTSPAVVRVYLLG